MDNFSPGGEPSTSRPLHTPCSLVLLAVSWLGFGMERTVSLPVLGLCLRWGPCPLLSAVALVVLLFGAVLLWKLLNRHTRLYFILTIHPFLERNEKFQFQSLACFSLTCFSQQVMALLCHSLRLPHVSLARQWSKTLSSAENAKREEAVLPQMLEETRSD